MAHIFGANDNTFGVMVFYMTPAPVRTALPLAALSGREKDWTSL